MDLTQYQNIYSYLNTQQYLPNISPRDCKQLLSQSQHFTISNNQLPKQHEIA
ncbi:3644_t:CDS:1, partial [Dentiscutata erythropus]